jgi:hypothetical protein
MPKAIKPIQRTYDTIIAGWSTDELAAMRSPELNRYKVGDIVVYDNQQHIITNIANFVARLESLNNREEVSSQYLKDLNSVRQENLKLI